MKKDVNAGVDDQGKPVYIPLSERLIAYLKDKTEHKDKQGNIIEGDTEGKRLLTEDKTVREYLGIQSLKI